MNEVLHRIQHLATEYSPVCIGIDPHPGLLEQWGLSVDIAGLRHFSNTVVEACAGRVGFVKPQIAFFEQFGSAGFAVLEETLGSLREAGIFIIADAKRGDIGSTMRGYAQAWLDPASPLAADSLTVTPYLGFGSLAPVLELAAEHNRAIFVLSATSNPEARHVQNMRDDQDVTLSQHIVNEVGQWNAQRTQGLAGVVLGATLPSLPDISELGGPILMPGVGAQGATYEDVARLVTGSNAVALPNISRAVLSQGPELSELEKHIDQQVELARQAFAAGA